MCRKGQEGRKKNQIILQNQSVSGSVPKSITESAKESMALSMQPTNQPLYLSLCQSYHFRFLLLSLPKKLAAAVPAFLRAASHWDSFHLRQSLCHNRLMIAVLLLPPNIQQMMKCPLHSFSGNAARSPRAPQRSSDENDRSNPRVFSDDVAYRFKECRERSENLQESLSTVAMKMTGQI